MVALIYFLYTPLLYAIGSSNIFQGAFYNQVLFVITLGFLLLWISGFALFLFKSKARWGAVITLPFAYFAFALALAVGHWALAAVQPPWTNPSAPPSVYFGNTIMYHGVAKGAVHVGAEWMKQMAVFTVCYLTLAIIMIVNLFRKDAPAPAGQEWKYESTK